MTREKDTDTARQGRIVAVVIIATAIIWVLAIALGPRLGLSNRVAGLIDLAALGAFLWAIIVTFGIWRRRKD